jgi:DNA polymerase III subunit gamma/tau
MEYQVSARRHRPMTFDEVSGQPHVVRTLTNALASGRTAHAYLFSGMRGVGKTTMARILAKALNCAQGPTAKPCLKCPSCLEISSGSSFDVMEIDGASSNSVDDVREMRETIKTAPAHARYRVFIIDEVHMLSTAAFNALLKTLEEPPGHVVFIFATTEAHKIPATILSRCQHFTFRRISRREIMDQLKKVAHSQGITIDEYSLSALARASEGSMRDALCLLDQAVAFSGKQVKTEELMVLLGSVARECLREVVGAILGQDAAQALRAVATVQDRGADLRQFCTAVLEHFRNVLIAKLVPDNDDLIELAPEELVETKADAQQLSVEQVQEVFQVFAQTEEGIQSTQHPWFLMEMAVVKACRIRPRGGESSVNTPTDRPAATSQPARAIPTGSDRPSVRPRPGPVESSPSTPDPAQPRRPDPERANGEISSSAAPFRTDATSFDWEAVVAQLHTTRPNIAAFLDDTALLEFDQEIVTIGYPASAGAAMKMVLREDYQRIVLDACRAIAGRPVRLKVVTLDPRASVATIWQLRQQREAATEQRLRQEALANPIVKEALTVFSGEVKEVKRKPAR